ncbi:LPS assembly protein LptD [Arenimonas composti]|uniref:LPS-assembly protein LptD n=1 Tax=Arenimonas composti TR7-09 = DSM 18010 TaxID=1121013 RepID=A0A091BC12_9GAMM|nr:LPS assembly protein LptD [Arenimonas composti]KFN49296.1 hypothetical protein P873_11665 [Arenimonas composti TR7-09 = DSM 18010]
MPKVRLLSLSLALALAGNARADDVPSAGDDWALCPAAETLPLFQPLATGPAPVSNKVDIDASDFVYEENRTTARGAVELRQQDRWLGTEELVYHHDSETFESAGEVKYQDRRMRFLAGDVHGNQAEDSLRLRDVQYQFNDQLGNGRADVATVQGEVGRLEGATYSTCPPGQRQWEFSAGSIEVDQASGMGTARDATVRLGGVPVLWLPYLRFPTDERRRTGLLAPNLGWNDDDGLKYEQPIYLNLAPNYDATLTPRLYGRRGLMIGGEFRYLLPRHHGEVEALWLPDDRRADRDRGLFRWRHFSSLDAHWYASADLNHVSDDEYFEDFGDSLSATSVSLLNSRAGLYGRGLGWHLSLEAQDWQITSPWLAPGAEPYRELPALRGAWTRPLHDWLEVGLRGEAVRFDHDTLADGTRVDLQPFLRLPFGGPAWYAMPEFSWRYTHYSLDRALVPPGGDDSPSRSLPVMSLDAGAFFEREFQWRGEGVVQTLEPRLFYLYAPYREQDHLPLFDTQPLTLSWPGLFRSNRFSGGDRQADADQVTVALTSRVLGAADGREWLSASIGRVHYFTPPRVTIPGAPALSDEGSAWVVEASLSPSGNWNLGLAHQWDPDGERTPLSAVRGQWRFGDGGLVNASYRYREDLVEQTDLSFVLPVSQQWSVLGRWNWSLRDHASLESLLGVEWRSCCVALRVVAREYVREFTGEQRTGIYIELQLNGIGGLGRDTVRLLDDAILDYSRYSR